MSATLLESAIRLLYHHRNEPRHHCAMRELLRADLRALRRLRRADNLQIIRKAKATS